MDHKYMELKVNAITFVIVFMQNNKERHDRRWFMFICILDQPFY